MISGINENQGACNVN